MFKHKKASFDRAMNAFDKELSAASVEFATLWWNGDEVLSKLKGLEKNLGESMEVASERTTEYFLMNFEQFETERRQGLEKNFAYLKY